MTNSPEKLRAPAVAAPPLLRRPDEREGRSPSADGASVGLLAMQRLAGNAAVASVLANRLPDTKGHGPVVQRDDPHATATTPSFQPKVESDTRAGQLNVGADLAIHLTVTNYSDAPPHLKMLVDPGYAGDVLSAKGAVADGKTTIAVSGLKLGEALLKPVLVSEDTRAPFKVHGPRTKLRVTSRQELAAEALVTGHQERMFGGGDWEKNDSEKATRRRLEAEDADNEALDKAQAGQKGHTLRIEQILEPLRQDIRTVETARSAGFTLGLAEIASTALNSESTTSSFIWSLVGNTVWAVSTFIPMMGAIEALEKTAANALLSKLSLQLQNKETALGGIFGIGGMALAQFSNGLPHGAKNQSERLQSMTQQVETLNSNICNGRRDQAEILVADAIAKNPPAPGDDVAAYLAHLENTVRYVVLGGIYEKNQNAGVHPDYAKVKLAAANDFKAAYFAENVRLDNDGDVVPTSDLGRGDLRKMIEKGGAGSIRFDEYQLATAKVFKALRAMGCDPDEDLQPKVKDLLNKGSMKVPVTWKGSSIDFANFRQGVLQIGQDPQKFNYGRPSRYPFDRRTIKSIDSIELNASDASVRKGNGTTGPSLVDIDRVQFNAHGGIRYDNGGQWDIYRDDQLTLPNDFPIIYNLVMKYEPETG